jgi:serine/threonine protein kinase
VVEHVTDCNDVLSPLVQEYVFRKIINDEDISPKVSYLSPAVRPADLPLQLARFRGQSLDKFFRECSHLGSSVRFLVQERAGISLASFARYNVQYHSPRFAQGLIRIGREILDKLEVLHSLGIVHGDIHAGNIVHKTPAQDIGEMSIDFRLINFQHAMFFPAYFNRPKNGKDYSNFRTRYLSLWQLSGERIGPRDDILRLIYVLGDILSKGKYFEGVERMVEANLHLLSNKSRNSKEFVDMKKQVELFARRNFPLFNHSVDLASKVFTGLPDDLERIVADNLEAIHDHVVSTYIHPDMKIDYARIRASMDEVIVLFLNYIGHIGA